MLAVCCSPVEGVEGGFHFPLAQAQLPAQTLNDPSATCRSQPCHFQKKRGCYTVPHLMVEQALSSSDPWGWEEVRENGSEQRHAPFRLPPQQIS